MLKLPGRLSPFILYQQLEAAREWLKPKADRFERYQHKTIYDSNSNEYCIVNDEFGQITHIFIAATDLRQLDDIIAHDPSCGTYDIYDPRASYSLADKTAKIRQVLKHDTEETKEFLDDFTRQKKKHIKVWHKLHLRYYHRANEIVETILRNKARIGPRGLVISGFSLGGSVAQCLGVLLIHRLVHETDYFLNANNTTHIQVYAIASPKMRKGHCTHAQMSSYYSFLKNRIVYDNFVVNDTNDIARFIPTDMNNAVDASEYLLTKSGLKHVKESGWTRNISALLSLKKLFAKFLTHHSIHYYMHKCEKLHDV